MSKKKVLFVTQEMEPYTVANEISRVCRALPQHIQEKGMELRLLMPRYGTINERRHRLHEVVRLSGMNIIVDDDDFPLIIKVASIPKARMQVYFLDNEDFFKRKFIHHDKNGKPFKDNADRMVFFNKGIIETVKKFGWAPDIVHCHGWMTSLLPAFIREAYRTEPLFHESKIVYSLYDTSLEENFTEDFFVKAAINNLDEEVFEPFRREDGSISLHRGALHWADAVVRGSEEYSEENTQLLEETDLPVLDFPGATPDEFNTKIREFYLEQITEEEVEEVEG